jgi:hypothetical protein
MKYLVIGSVIAIIAFVMYKLSAFVCCKKCHTPGVKHTKQRLPADKISPQGVIRRRICNNCGFVEKRIDWVGFDCTLKGEWEEDLSGRHPGPGMPEAA